MLAAAGSAPLPGSPTCESSENSSATSHDGCAQSQNTSLACLVDHTKVCAASHICTCVVKRWSTRVRKRRLHHFASIAGSEDPARGHHAKNAAAFVVLPDQVEETTTL